MKKKQNKPRPKPKPNETKSRVNHIQKKVNKHHFAIAMATATAAPVIWSRSWEKTENQRQPQNIRSHKTPAMSTVLSQQQHHAILIDAVWPPNKSLRVHIKFGTQTVLLPRGSLNFYSFVFFCFVWFFVWLKSQSPWLPRFWLLSVWFIIQNIPGIFLISQKYTTRFQISNNFGYKASNATQLRNKIESEKERKEREKNWVE